jgi:aspartate-semialdehyde dehydrogenase
MDERIGVGILGATGMVGQQFIALLARHPWFRVVWVGASEKSARKKYRDAAAWRLSAPLPDEIADREVQIAAPSSTAPKLMFSGLDSSVAGEIEGAFAKAGHTVVSNSRNYRMERDVPLLIPEVNADHLALLNTQASRGWKGRIVTNPNCSTVVLAMALAPLRQFGLNKVTITTLQAISGAGYPGVASWDILGNVIPFIDGEEHKIETETKKILGCVANDTVDPHPVVISAQTTRVPVHDGHTESISVGFDHRPSEDDMIAAWTSFKALEGLPSAPAAPIVYLRERNRPQPSLDVNRSDGMTVTVGRLRSCPILDYKFIALGHNTIRGAAGVAILNAELMHRQGLL